jgi:hypothetical protein
MAETATREDTETKGMWNAFVDGKEPPEDTTPTESEEAAKEEKPDADATDSPDNDEHDADAGGDDTESGEKAEDDSEDTPDEDADPWAAVPEALRVEHEKLAEKFEKALHENRSNRARVAALQKKVDSLSLKPAEAKPEAKEPPAKELDAFFKDSETWKKFAEDYEEVAGPIKDAISLPFGSLRERLEKAEKLVETLSESMQAQHQHSELQTLNRVVPDWFDTISKNQDAFSVFVADPDSPEELRNLRRAIVDANAETIVKSDAVAWLVKEFKSHLAAQNPPAPKQEQRKPESKPIASAPLNPKREKQLKSAVSVPPKSAPSPGSRSDDLPETEDRAALWNAFVQKIEKTAAR